MNMNTLRHFAGSRSKVLAVFAVTLALCLAPAAMAQAQGQPRNLHMVSVGITNAIGQPHLKATAKDARDMAKWANSQKGKLFGQVHVTTLTDNAATRQNVLNALSGLQGKVQANDYVVFYVSSHGSASNGQWSFCAYDTSVSWIQIQNALNNVSGIKIAILDTCFAGAAAQYSGNLIVFSACLANQLSHDGSSAGGNSIYTQYLLEGLYGPADANHNGLITLTEATSYASAKLKQIYQGKAAKDQQFSTWAKPKSISGDLPLAKVSPTASVATNVAGTTWSGSEQLGGYGKLTFVMQPDGKAIMYDAKSTVPGTWTQNGHQVTLTFAKVQATYHGTVYGTTMSGQGIGSNGGSWDFTVHKTK
jgi:hypothetical protein